MIDTRTAPYAALLLRVALGTMWIAHGLLKLVVFTPAGLAGFLGSLGLPAFLAWPMIIAEIGGGLLILLGVYGRQVSVLLLPILLGATWVHAGNGWLFSAANGGWEFPVFLVATSIAHALLGDGAYAVKSTASLVPAERVTLAPAE
jgi:putative oxidoreductase